MDAIYEYSVHPRADDTTYQSRVKGPDKDLPANSSVLFLIYARIGDLEAIKNLIKREEEADFYNQRTLARRFSSSSCFDRALFDKEIKNDAGLSALAIAMRNKDMILATYLLREHKLDPESTNVVSLN